MGEGASRADPGRCGHIVSCTTLKSVMLSTLVTKLIAVLKTKGRSTHPASVSFPAAGD